MENKFGWNDLEFLIKTTIAEAVKGSLNDSITQKILNGEDGKLTLTINEAAELTGVGRNLMYQWANSKGFPMIRVGRKILIIKSKFIEWLEENIGNSF